MCIWYILGLVDGVILECTLGTENIEGVSLGTMLSPGAYDAIGLAVVDEANDCI